MSNTKCPTMEWTGDNKNVVLTGNKGVFHVCEETKDSAGENLRLGSE